MLDLIGTVVLVAVIALNISAFSNAMPISAAARLTIPAVAGAWTGLAAAVAAAGMFADTSLVFPWVGAFVAFPLWQSVARPCSFLRFVLLFSAFHCQHWLASTSRACWGPSLLCSLGRTGWADRFRSRLAGAT